MQRGLLFFLLALICVSINSEDSYTNEEDYLKPSTTNESILETGAEGVWKTYRYVDGLATNDVRAMLQDKDGSIWFATARGVSCFNGGSWHTYTKKDGLVDDGVSAIMQDKEGAIWFGTAGGVSQFDGKNWKTYTEKDGLVTNYVQAIMQDKEGAIWFATGNGVSCFDGRIWRTYTKKDGLVDNNVSAIMQDKEGSIWFGTDGGGISRFNGRSWVIYSAMNGLASNYIKAIIQSKDRSIWVGTWGGISRFDGINWKTYTMDNGLANNSVNSLTEDNKGVIWVGTWWGGISRFDGKNWKTYTKNDGLTSNAIQVVMEDTEGTIWIGTFDGGVSRFDMKRWKTYSSKNGLWDDRVEDIMQDRDGTMWFIVWYAAGTFDRGVWQEYEREWVYDIMEDRKGVIWFGTDKGIIRHDGKSRVIFTKRDGLASNSVRVIIQDNKGVIWCGTDNGISQYDGKKWKTYTQKDGLTSNYVCTIIQDNEGFIWCGGYGVSQFDGKRWKTYTQKDGLAGNYVRTIIQDNKGLIWCGTSDGISQFDGKNWKTYTKKDGLASDNVKAITQDKKGIIWIGTWDGGVSRFDGRCFQTIDSRDGLINDAVNCIYMDRNGRVWIGTQGGAVQLMTPDKVLPPVYINRIVADEKIYSPVYEKLKLPADVVRVVFGFHAVSFKTCPGKMLYYYHLVGHDSDWQGPISAEMVEYFNLKQGNYTFRLQAVDIDLNYSQPVSLDITISPPPFYKQTGFMGGSIFAAFLIPSIIYASMLNRQKRKQAFEIISNPYIVGNPIRSGDMFFGREDDFRFVQAKLGRGETGIVIVFAGERRSGKTSILFQILNGRLGDQFVPILLDMQAMTVDNEAEFFEKIASEINSALDERVNIPANAFRDGNPTRPFEKFIADVMTILDSKSLLFLFDEYELLETKIDDGVLRPDIITFFASLLEKHSKLSFIFTGSRHLEQRNPRYWSILIGKSIYRKISFLSELDTMRLIKEPVKGSVVYPKGIPERIYRLTSGQPFYTQVVCQNIVDRLNAEQRNRIIQGDMDAVSQELAENPPPQMIYFWDGLEHNQRIALSLLGEVLGDSIRYVSAKAMLGFAVEHELDFGIELAEMERILDDLFTHDVLERERVGDGNYEYRFRVDLFRIWIRQSQSIWQSS